ATAALHLPGGSGCVVLGPVPAVSVPGAARSVAMAGYSGTPLAKKLGVKPGTKLLTVGAPDGYRQLLHPVPDGVDFVSRVSASTEIVHLFSTSRSKLKTALTSYRGTLNATAVIWVSWPKKSSRVTTDITEDVVREVALPLG